jgi:hypothetical protein
MHSESGCQNPTIYKYRNRCKKALVTCEGMEKLQSVCGNGEPRLEDYGKTDKNQWFYVNY